MAPLDLGGLAGRRELFPGELVNRVELAKARFAIDLLDPNESLVDQRHEPIDDVAANVRCGSADDLGDLEIAPADEDGQPSEQPALAFIEEIVAPGDRSTESLLPLRQVAGASRQHAKLMFQSAEDRLRREQLDSGGSELDCERHAMEAGADPSHGRGVLV